MSDAFDQTAMFKRFRATPSLHNPMDDKVQAQIAFDEVLTPLGVRAPAPRPNESDADYLAVLGQTAAMFGPEERKSINRRALPSAALAEIVKADLEIAKAEIDRPRYSLKPGELREVIKTDQGGHQISEFYSDEATGVKPWFDQFKPQEIKLVSGGSAGIATPDNPPASTYNFRKSQVLPEVVALLKRVADQDTPENRIAAAFKAAGMVPTDQLRK